MCRLHFFHLSYTSSKEETSQDTKKGRDPKDKETNGQEVKDRIKEKIIASHRKDTVF